MIHWMIVIVYRNKTLTLSLKRSARYKQQSDQILFTRSKNLKPEGLYTIYIPIFMVADSVNSRVQKENILRKSGENRNLNGEFRRSNNNKSRKT